VLPTSVLAVSLFFFCGAMGHFFATSYFVAIMPDYLHFHRELVHISGVFELLGSIGILIQRTRRLAGFGLIVLCIVVFPANLNMALHPATYPDFPPLILYLRLPIQLLIIGYIARVVRREASLPTGISELHHTSVSY
jgi:uncharacterized membrane protein